MFIDAFWQSVFDEIKGGSMTFLQRMSVGLGRLCIGGVFLAFVVQEYLTWPMPAQMFQATLERWESIYHEMPEMQSVLSFMVTWSPFLLLGAVLLKLFGALMLVFGWRVRLAATFLLLFLVPTTIMVHDFWHPSSTPGCAKIEFFLRNVSVIGALLFVLAYGKGGKSSKEKSAKKDG